MPARTLGGIGRSSQSARLKLRFTQCDTAVDPRITVTRASTTWRVNSAGIYVPVAANAPVIEYNPLSLAIRGLRIRPATTNLLTYSEDIGNAAYSKGGASVGASSSGRGITLKKLTESALNEEHYVYSPAAVVTGGASIAGSVFVMAGGSTYCQIRLTSYNGTYSAAIAFLNLTNGTQRNASLLVGGAVSGTVSIEDWGGGLYRIGIVGVLASNVTQAGIIVYLQRAAGAFNETTYTGDGSTGTYLGGFMLREGSTVGSYIPTTSAQVTVPGDTVAITGTAFTDIWNPNQGTWFWRALTQSVTTYPHAVSADNGGSSNDRIASAFDPAFQLAFSYVRNSGVQSSGSSASVSPGTVVKGALSMKSGNFVAAYNGALVAASAANMPTNSTRLVIGGGDAPLDGYIESLDYYGAESAARELLEGTA